MYSKKTLFMGLVFGLMLFTTLKLYSLSFTSSAAESLGNLNRQENTTDQINPKDLTKLIAVMSIIKKYYVTDMNTTQIVDKSIKGLLNSLDSHSSFLNASSYNELKKQTDGKFSGIGAVITIKNGALTIVSPLDDSPAKKAKIKPGDIILKIDNEPTLDLSLDVAVNKLKGKDGSKVKLLIYRQGSLAPFEVELKREIIKIESVSSKDIENEDIKYIRISSFNKEVANDVKKIITNNPKVKGIILDLRNNPGGLLDESLKLVNLFMNEGVIAYQRGRNKSEDIVYKANSQDSYTQIPLVILINEGSASASEIVSGSLQDNKRAILVGEKTFGKGSVQVVIPLKTKDALKLTVAEYYLPSGRSIQAVGVEPDISIDSGEILLDENDELIIREKDLRRHLKNELAKSDDSKNTQEDKSSTKQLITKDSLYKDIQLKGAVDAVKVLILEKSK